MIKYKDKQVMVTKDVDANTVIVQYTDGKEEIVQRHELVDDGQSVMLPGPADRLPPVTKTVPGKEINIHIPDRDIEIPYTKEQLAEQAEARKTDKASVEKRAKAAQEKAKADQAAYDKAAKQADSKGPVTVKSPWL